MSGPPGAVGGEEPRAADGRVPGRRGRATRQRLLQETAQMLKATSYRDLKVVDIARAARTSPATFYQYFPDVEAAVLVLAEEMITHGARFPVLVRRGRWRGRAGWATACELVDGFLAFWEEHRSVLRVVDLATAEGDARFHNVRTRLLNGLTVALREAIEQRTAGRPTAGEGDPMATAGVLVAMLAHVAAHRYGFEFWGIRTDDVRGSMARLIYWSVSGQRPPGGGEKA